MTDDEIDAQIVELIPDGTIISKHAAARLIYRAGHHAGYTACMANIIPIMVASLKELPNDWHT